MVELEVKEEEEQKVREVEEEEERRLLEEEEQCIQEKEEKQLWLIRAQEKNWLKEFMVQQWQDRMVEERAEGNGARRTEHVGDAGCGKRSASNQGKCLVP